MTSSDTCGVFYDDIKLHAIFMKIIWKFLLKFAHLLSTKSTSIYDQKSHFEIKKWIWLKVSIRITSCRSHEDTTCGLFHIFQVKRNLNQSIHIDNKRRKKKSKSFERKKRFLSPSLSTDNLISSWSFFNFLRKKNVIWIQEISYKAKFSNMVQE